MLIGLFVLNICVYINLTPFMKHTPYLLIAAAVALVPAQSQATTQTQYANNVSIPSANTPVDYSSFLAFNSNLGTLNSVTFYIDSVTLSGFFIYNQNGSGSSALTGFTGHTTVWYGSEDGPSSYNGLSSGQYNGLSADIITSNISLTLTNDLADYSISRGGSRTFIFDGSQQLISSPVSADVSTGDYNNGTYYAPRFTILNEIAANGSQGGSPSIVWTGVTGSANLRLVYDYNAIPEPSTYGIGLGVLALAAIAVRRRKVKA